MGLFRITDKEISATVTVSRSGKLLKPAIVACQKAETAAAKGSDAKAVADLRDAIGKLDDAMDKIAGDLDKKKDAALLKSMKDQIEALQKRLRELDEAQKSAEKQKAADAKRPEPGPKADEEPDTKGGALDPAKCKSWLLKLPQGPLPFACGVTEDGTQHLILDKPTANPAALKELLKKAHCLEIAYGSLAADDKELVITVLKGKVNQLARVVKECAKAVGSTFTSARTAKADAAAADAADDEESGRDAEALAEAPKVWLGTRSILQSRIDALKKAVRTAFASEAPAIVKGLDKDLAALDGLLAKLDDRLAGSLAKAGDAKDAESRDAELDNSRAILTEYARFLQSSRLIARIDANPFGVDTNLAKLLTESLAFVAKAVA